MALLKPPPRTAGMSGAGRPVRAQATGAAAQLPPAAAVAMDDGVGEGALPADLRPGRAPAADAAGRAFLTGAQEGPGSVFGWRFSGELRGVPLPGKETTMAIILAVLLLALILGGLGFAVHVLWFIALVVLVLWLLGFFLTGAGTGGPRRRWYRW
jgi:hypothetical protein